LVVEVSMLTLA